MKNQSHGPIAPLSIVRLIRADRSTPGWKKDVGREFRIGYYSEQDGLDCVWLVNEQGEYEQTTDQAQVKTHFEVVQLSNEDDLFGVSRRPLSQLAGRLAFKDKPGLVAYVTCGDPDLATTKDVVLAAIKAGADVIELGVPFSDPVADGPVIQRASQRALEHGTRLADVLDLARDVRKQSDAGLIVFSYLNPVLRFGLEKFADAAKAAGIDGALITDLTVEEAGDYLRVMRSRSLATVFLAAPTSTDARLKRIAAASTGFVYAVSRTGITGQQKQLSSDARDLVQRLRKFTKLPVAVGFGISSAEQFREVGSFADAVVIGSAIVHAIEQSGRAGAASAVAKLISEVKGRNSAASSRQSAQ